MVPSILSNEVLPPPELPRITTNYPWCIFRETPLKAATPFESKEICFMEVICFDDNLLKDRILFLYFLSLIHYPNFHCILRIGHISLSYIDKLQILS